MENKITPIKAIRMKCIDCSCGALDEVKNCKHTDCPLYPYRMGTNPARKGVGNISNVSQKTPTQLG